MAVVLKIEPVSYYLIRTQQSNAIPKVITKTNSEVPTSIPELPGDEKCIKWGWNDGLWKPSRGAGLWNAPSPTQTNSCLVDLV
jgi:hypothetical protein